MALAPLVASAALPLGRAWRKSPKRGRATEQLAQIALAQGETTTARLLIEQSHRLWQKVENQGMLASTRALLAKVLTVEGDYTAAYTMYEESLLQGLAAVDIAPALEGLAVVLTEQGETTRAMRLLAAAGRGA